ncbi:hypothetical protein fh0823_20400 [Francisella halioticida]|uniref:hypothetical protein n=1 Tax=Francisella halioticida TaxID=549298 RepID=UPI001AF0BABC|nr:hypothetical protein [Francisella halioticida]BCD91901.1 hypothetical protein fh0823_20400 [Francisella halioticida]
MAKLNQFFKKYLFIFLVFLAVSSCTQDKAYVRVTGNGLNKEISKSFPNKKSCEESIKKCQNSPNQIKPWLCGSCHPKN